VLKIDPNSGGIARVATLPHALAEPAAVARTGDIVVVGGENSDAVYSIHS